MEDIIAAIIGLKESSGMPWAEISRRSGVCYHTIIGWIDKHHAPRLNSLALVLYTLGMRLAIEKIEK